MVGYNCFTRLYVYFSLIVTFMSVIILKKIAFIIEYCYILKEYEFFVWFFRFLIPQSQKATDIITKQILDFIERNESWRDLYNLLQLFNENTDVSFQNNILNDLFIKKTLVFNLWKIKTNFYFKNIIILLIISY